MAIPLKMTASPTTRIKLRPWLAGLLGIGIGLAGHHGFCKGGDETGASAIAQGTLAGGQNSLGSAPRTSRSATATQIIQLGTATAAECEERVSKLCGARSSGNGLELEQVLRRWMELEKPEVLLVRIPELLNARPSGDWRGAFFRAWAAQDYSGAMARSKDLSEFKTARVLAAITAHDPEFQSILASAGSLTPGVFQALRTLGREHPDLARSVAGIQVPDQTHQAAVQMVAAGMASRNPQDAWDWLRSLHLEDKANAQACCLVLAEWLKTDAPSAIAACQASGIDPAKLTSDAAAAFYSQPGKNALHILTDPATAASQLFLAIHQNPCLDVAGLYQVLSTAKLAWDKPENPVPGIDCDGWSCPDPAAAAKQAEQLPPGKERDYILDNLNRQWFAQDPTAATTFAETHHLTKLPDHWTGQSAAIDPQAVREAADAPQQTFAELFKPEAEVIPGTDTAKLYNLAMAWAASDPPAVADWLLDPAPAARRTMSARGRPPA